jgi:hypothetical protein
MPITPASGAAFCPATNILAQIARLFPQSRGLFAGVHTLSL